MSDSGAEHKVPLNEACIACRGVKRKCIHPGTGDLCTRCDRLKLECVYKQEKRGRKPGQVLGALKVKRPRLSSTSNTSEASPNTTSDSNERREGVPDWLFQDLGAQQLKLPSIAADHVNDHTSISANGGSSLASTSRLEPLVSVAGLSAPSLTSTSASTASQDPTPLALPNPNLTTVHSPTPTSNSPATGGFSLKRLLGTKNQAPGLSGSLADAFAYEEEGKSNANAQKRVEPDRSGIGKDKTLLDVVHLGLVREDQVDDLFVYYFEHLNPMTCILDPVLHTPTFCRSRSAFLFSAILTVTVKVQLPESTYAACLRHINSLYAHAFESGLNTLELVQAFATTLFWSESTDDTISRRLAYTLRSSFELGLHKKAKRPLPEDEHAARLVLNPERTWLYLMVADHRLSTQRSIPRIIPSEWRYDPLTWHLEHRETVPCPTEVGLSPVIALSRLLDLYTALMAVTSEGETPSRAVLTCLENEFTTWKRNWADPQTPSVLPLPGPVASLLRFYVSLWRFQLDEVHLLLSMTAPTGHETHSFDASSSPILAFGRCVRSAISVLAKLQDELTRIVYPFDSMWIGTASCAIWLAQNFAGMSIEQRTTVTAGLKMTLKVSKEVERGPTSMPAYTARLLDHLIKKSQDVAPPSTTKEETSTTTKSTGSEGLQAESQNPPFARHFVTASPSSAFDPLWTTSLNTFGGVPALSVSGANALGNGASPAAGWNVPIPGGQAQQQQTSTAFDLALNPFLNSMIRPMGSLGEDLVYPPADDQLWQSFFPMLNSRE